MNEHFSSNDNNEKALLSKQRPDEQNIVVLMFSFIITIICFLLLIASSLALDPCYSSFYDISSREILGSWVKGLFYDQECTLMKETCLNGGSMPVRRRVESGLVVDMMPMRHQVMDMKHILNGLFQITVL